MRRKREEQNDRRFVSVFFAQGGSMTMEIPLDLGEAIYMPNETIRITDIYGKLFTFERRHIAYTLDSTLTPAEYEEATQKAQEGA